MNNSDSRQLYNRLYRQFALREIYRCRHLLDGKSVGMNWSELMKYTRKVEGVMYSGNDGNWHVELS